MNPEPLLNELLAFPAETEWVEFKHNNDAPEEIGEYLSALANAAALHGRDAGYLVWGIEDGTHRIVGITAQPRKQRVGNEQLENWLAHLLLPRVDFRFFEWEHHGRRMVLLRVQPAVGSPVSFRGTEWIRVGSHKKKLREHPGKEQQLWLALSRLNFEKSIAATGASGRDVLESLDCLKYFELLGQKLPVNRLGILERLTVDSLIFRRADDQYDITNLGGILFAKRLGQFGELGRKALRVIRYRGTSRVETEHEKPALNGYAAGFEEVVGYINDQLPRNEVLGEALRKEVRMYPERAIRELVANAMIHQDFGMRGTGRWWRSSTTDWR